MFLGQWVLAKKMSEWIPFWGLIACYLLNGVSAGSSNFFLENKAFGIRSRVAVDRGDRRVNHVDEYYDAAQERARISFGAEKEFRREFYYEGYSDLGLITDHKQGSCEPYTKHDIRVSLMADSEQVLEYFRTLDNDVIRHEEHIVGPSSVLFLVASHGDLVEHISTAEDHANGYRLWRNLEAEYYQLDFEFDKDRKARLTLAYHARDAQNIEPKALVNTAIPIAVDIMFPDTTLIVIDYFDHWLYSDAEYIKSGALDIGSREDLMIDLFALPLHANCSFIADHALVHKSPFKNLHTSSVQYSFEVSTDELKGEKLLRQFVAFDGTTMLARLDNEQVGQTVDQSAWTQGDTNILDFRSNRKYIILEPRVVIPKRGLSSSEGNKADELPVLGSLVETTESSRCASTYLYSDDESRAQMSLLEMFLFGVNEKSDEMIYLGQSSVRGIRAQIFKARVQDLPYWYGEPVVYRTSDGKLGLRYRGRQLTGGSDTNQKLDNHYALVYVSYDVCPAPVVLLYELYELLPGTSIGTTSAKPVFRSEIYNFFWHLNEAPNGDSGSKLFDYRETCAKLDGQHVEVSMVASIRDQLENINWMFEPTKRDQSIRAQVLRLFGVSSLMLYDFESHIIGSGKVWFNFKVAEHRQVVLQIKFLNRADLLDEGGDSVVKHSQARTLLDCLWMVGTVGDSTEGNLLRARYVLYTQEDQTCVVDYRPYGSSRMGGSYAIGADGRGELFVIEPNVDPIAGLSHTFLIQNQDLEGRKMIIISYDESMAMYDPVDVQLELDEVRIKRLNQPSTAVDTKRIGSETKLSLANFRMQKSEFSRMVQLADEGNKGSFIESGHCESACLADTDCISYSYCEPNFDDDEHDSFESKNGECLLSKVDFTAIGKDELEKLSQQISGYKQVIEFNSNLGPVELHRNHRCNIHRKRFKDLFLSDLPRRVVLNDEQVDVYQVDNDEKCAELCFSRNVDTIKASVELTGKINGLVSMDRGKLNLDKPRTAVIEGLRTEYNDLVRGFCTRYLYLDYSWSKSQLKALEASALKLTGDATKQSFCALDKTSTSSNVPRKTSSQFIFDSYDFDFSKMYSRLAGFKMMSSSMGYDEVSSLVELQTGASLNRKQLDTLLIGLRHGNNYQIPVASKTISQCARACFQTQTYVWPSCRSFDIKVTEDEKLMCLLNTARVDRTKALDEQQVLQKTDTNERVIHFELISPLVKDKFDGEEKLKEYIEIDKSILATMGNTLVAWSKTKVFIVFAGVLTGFGVVCFGRNWFSSGLSDSDRQLLATELY